MAKDMNIPGLHISSPEINQQQNNHKISIISWVNNNQQYLEMKNSIKFPCEFIEIGQECKSMAEAYNKGTNLASGNILLYCHQDIRFIDEDFLNKIIEVVNRPNSGICSTNGNNQWSDGAWWDSPQSSWIGDKHYNGPACQLDGQFFVTDKKFIFPEELSGIHFLDNWICKEAERLGYTNYGFDATIKHLSQGKMDASYFANKEIYQKFWKLGKYKNLKFGAMIPVLNEWRFLQAVIGQMLNHVDKCVIFRNKKTHSGALVEIKPMPKFDSRVEIIEGEWEDEGDARNYAIKYLADCDWVFNIDSDEILLDSDIIKLKEICKTTNKKVIGTKILTYWKTPYYKIAPPEKLIAPMIIKRGVSFIGKDARWPQERNEIEVSDIWMHHLSYIRTNEELQEKLKTFCHADQILSNWYENVWLKWDNNKDMHNLHPTYPPAYGIAIKTKNAELIKILETYNCLKDI
jgi:glycosyltransferase involved in cell wall biosynthesis